MILPIELFGTLTDILKDDRPSLKSLSLTHRSLTPLSQRHLFHHITVGGEIDDVDRDNSILVAMTDKSHSHLLSYIQSLTLRNVLGHRLRFRSSAQYIPNPILPKFIDTIAPQLTSLNLKNFAPGWDHDDALPLRRSIIRLLTETTKLTHLGMDNVNRFNITLLNRCSSLKSLKFATPHPSYALVPGHRSDLDSKTPIELETLEIEFPLGEFPVTNFMGWITGQGKAKCKISLAKLQRLEVNACSTKEVSAKLHSLLAQGGASLKHLILGPDIFEFDPVAMPPLPALDTLQFAYRLTYHPDPVSCMSTNGLKPFPYLVNLLAPSSSFTHGNNSLRCIEVHCELAVRPHGQLSPFYTERDRAAPGTHRILSDYFDILVDVLKEGVRSGRLDQLRKVRVGIQLRIVWENPDINPDQYVYHHNFVAAFRERFGDFGSLPSDHVDLEFYELAEDIHLRY